MPVFGDLIEELSLLLQNYNLNITLQNKSNWFDGENDLLSLWLNVDVVLVVLIVDIVDVATVVVVRCTECKMTVPNQFCWFIHD